MGGSEKEKASSLFVVLLAKPIKERKEAHTKKIFDIMRLP
jgi:hypothetical protein